MNHHIPPSGETDGEMLRARISAKHSLYVKSVDAGIGLEEPVFAVNWFNTKTLWLYNLYNLLASVSVKKVGGKALFKGRTQKVLYGDETLRRDVLLIVNYPGVGHFLRMMKSRYFLFVSTLRMLAVRQFSFGFTHRTETRDTPVDDPENRVYAVHHYCGPTGIGLRLEAVIRAHNLEVCYAGRISSLLYTGDDRQAKQQVPCLMDGVLLLGASSDLEIQLLMQEASYQSLIAETETSFIATLERIL